MKRNTMQTTSTIARVFETILSIPGMNENVKLQLSIPRKNVLILSKVIERGLACKEPSGDDIVLEMASKEMLEELNGIANELLEKAGLSAMNEKLNALK
jgi:hypothetical protein